MFNKNIFLHFLVEKVMINAILLPKDPFSKQHLPTALKRYTRLEMLSDFFSNKNKDI